MQARRLTKSFECLNSSLA